MIKNTISFKHGRFTITAKTHDNNHVEIIVLNTKTGETRPLEQLGSDLLKAEIWVNVADKLGISTDITDQILGTGEGNA